MTSLKNLLHVIFLSTNLSNINERTSQVLTSAQSLLVGIHTNEHQQ